MVKDYSVYKIINDYVKTSNCIVIKTYLFLRLYTLYNYHNNIPNPDLTEDLVEYVIRTISVRTENRGRQDKKNMDLKNSISEFYTKEFEPLLPNEPIESNNKMKYIISYLKSDILTCIQTNIKEHFITRLKRYLNIIHGEKFRKLLLKEKNVKRRKEIRKTQWEHINGILSDLCTNSLENSLNEYHEWIKINRNLLVPMKLKKNDVHYDIKCNPNSYINYGYYINNQLEKMSTDTKKYRLFQPFSTRNSVIPKYIKIDNACIVNLFAPDKKKGFLLNKQSKDQENRRTKLLNALWNTLFKTECKVFHSINGFTFARSFITDGISVSLLYISNQIANYNPAKRKKYNNKEIDWCALKDLNKYQLHYLLDKKIVGVDPGKSNLVFLADGNHTLRYTAMQKRYESGNKYYNAVLRNDKVKCNIHTLEQELSKYSCKTVNYNSFQEFIKQKLEINRKVRKYYEKEFHRHYRYKKFMRTQKSYDKFLNKVEEIFGPDIVLGYGNWSRKTQMKGHIPTVGKGLRKVISKRFNNITVDEYKTSKICYNCHCETDNIKINNKKVHRLLSCKNKDCETIWNRDLNASLNIMNLMTCFLHAKKRPDAFKR
jgi:hypothetical protein